MSRQAAAPRITVQAASTTPGASPTPSPTPSVPSASHIIGPYTVGPTIGAGIFAEVKAGTDEFRQQVAIKVFNKSAIMAKQTAQGGGGGPGGAGSAHPYSSHQFQQIEREINALRVCDHPHIVAFYDVLETETKVFLVMEHLPYGELYDYILDKGKLSEAEGAKLFGQVVSAIMHCHERGICHRDLKPENILLDATANLKVVDFGLANYWNSQDDRSIRSLRTQCGSPHYASPEVLRGERYSGPLADVWSLGVLLYAMVCGSLPFNARSIPMLIKKIVEGRFKLPKFLSPAAQHLIQTILQIVPENRPTLGEIAAHPWMQQHRAAAAGELDALEAAHLAANKLRPLSRPEIISPQSYVNAKPTALLFGMKGAGAHGEAAPSSASDSRGYLTASVHGIPPQEGGFDDGDDDDEEADIAEEHHADAGANGHRSIPTGAVATKAHPTGAYSQKRSPNEPHLPPSSALSFQQEATYLLGEEGNFGGATAGEGKGRAIPTSGRASITTTGFAAGGGGVASSPHWPSGSLLMRDKLSQREKRQALCGTCGKTLRLRTDDTGVLLLSSSVSQRDTHHLTAATPAEELCQCASTNLSSSPSIAAASRPSGHAGSAAPTRSTADAFATASTSSAPFSPVTPATPSSATGGAAGGLQQQLAASPAAKKSTTTTSPLKKALTKEELVVQERRYKDRCEALFKAAERGDEKALADMLEQSSRENRHHQHHHQRAGSATKDDSATTPDAAPAAAASASSTTGGARPSSPAPPASPPSLPPLDVRVTTIDSWNSLHYSARYGHEGVVRLLLTCWQPLDINSRTKQGWTPLMLAADQGHVGVVHLLLRYGAAIHVVNNDGKSAIFLARESGFPAIAQALTNASSARHLKHQSGLLQQQSTQVAPDGAQVRELNHEFFRAAECGDLAKVRHLLLLGKESNGTATPTVATASATASSANGASGGKSGEAAAAAPPRTPMARRQSPQVDAAAGAPTSPTSSASSSGSSSASPSPPPPRYCVDIRARGIDNWSVLHFAARKGRTAVVALLLDEQDPHPPEVNALTKNLWTPLMLAADRGHTETCALLLRRGADPNCTSMDGYTALSVAQEGGHSAIVALLLALPSGHTDTGEAPTANAATPAKGSTSRQAIAVTPVNAAASK